jgi:hypothetical protein
MLIQALQRIIPINGKELKEAVDSGLQISP